MSFVRLAIGTRGWLGELAARPSAGTSIAALTPLGQLTARGGTVVVVVAGTVVVLDVDPVGVVVVVVELGVVVVVLVGPPGEVVVVDPASVVVVVPA